MICGKRSNQEEVFAHIEVIEWTYTTLFYPEFILFLEVLFSCVMVSWRNIGYNQDTILLIKKLSIQSISPLTMSLLLPYPKASTFLVSS